MIPHVSLLVGRLYDGRFFHNSKSVGGKLHLHASIGALVTSYLNLEYCVLAGAQAPRPDRSPGWGAVLQPPWDHGGARRRRLEVTAPHPPEDSKL